MNRKRPAAPGVIRTRRAASFYLAGPGICQSTGESVMTFVRPVCISSLLLVLSLSTLAAQAPADVIHTSSSTGTASTAEEFACHIEWVGVARALKGDSTSFGPPVDAWNAELKHRPSHFAHIRPVVVVSTGSGD